MPAITVQPRYPKAGEVVRVRYFYKAATFRIQPAGLAYLWPVIG